MIVLKSMLKRCAAAISSDETMISRVMLVATSRWTAACGAVGVSKPRPCDARQRAEPVLGRHVLLLFEAQHDIDGGVRRSTCQPGREPKGRFTAM